MSTTLTIRTDDALRDALRERAALRGVSLSEAAREILRQAVIGAPLGERAGHIRGRLALGPGAGHSWRGQLRQRNWRS